LHTGIFNGPKSIGVKFAERFIEIAGNKAKRPEMPVPLLALVATAVTSFYLSLCAVLTRFQDLCSPVLEDTWFPGEVQLHGESIQ
jgi:hypothetical protein